MKSLLHFSTKEWVFKISVILVLLGTSGSESDLIAHSGEIANDVYFGVENHLVPRIVAKELCSCLYNSRLPYTLCKKKTGLPRFFSKLPIVTFRKQNSLIFVRARATLPNLTPTVFYQAEAVFDQEHPEEGCRLSNF